LLSKRSVAELIKESVIDDPGGLFLQAQLQLSHKNNEGAANEGAAIDQFDGRYTIMWSFEDPSFGGLELVV